MASPPFDISTVLPGDSDIVSQYPLNERNTRDVIESWILANHDTNGDHKWVNIPVVGSTPANPGSGIVKLFMDASGRLKWLFSDGSVGYVGLPPGSVFFTADDIIPAGYLLADGSAISRSTFADLFALLSTAYGAGNGSTTFNIPDLRGRVIAGVDGGVGRLTSTYLGVAATLANAGGNEFNQLDAARIPLITSSVSVSVSGTTQTVIATRSPVNSGIVVASSLSVGMSVGTDTGPAGFPGTFSGSGAGSASSNNTAGGAFGAGHANVQPTIIMTPIIKF